MSRYERLFSNVNAQRDTINSKSEIAGTLVLQHLQTTHPPQNIIKTPTVTITSPSTTSTAAQSIVLVHFQGPVTLKVDEPIKKCARESKGRSHESKVTHENSL